MTILNGVYLLGNETKCLICIYIYIYKENYIDLCMISFLNGGVLITSSEMKIRVIRRIWELT